VHELPVIDSILTIVLKHAASNHAHRVISVTLMIGEMSDLEEAWMQHYFNYLSQDTVAESALLKVIKVPVQVECSECHHRFEIAPRRDSEIICPICQSRKAFSMLSGREYYIKEMEVV
jgi:hydrogenase nickel incorporation protein HypA/HybF